MGVASPTKISVHLLKIKLQMKLKKKYPKPVGIFFHRKLLLPSLDVME